MGFAGYARHATVVAATSSLYYGLQNPSRRISSWTGRKRSARYGDAASSWAQVSRSVGCFTRHSVDGTGGLGQRLAESVARGSTNASSPLSLPACRAAHFARCSATIDKMTGVPHRETLEAGPAANVRRRIF